MKKTSKIILFFVLTLIIILVTVLILLFGSKKNEKVEIDTVEDLYKQFVEKNKENGNYHYKLYGYTYDENQNVEMSIMQAYVENNKVYDLDGKEIGDYSDDTIDEMLDKATTKIYYFTFKNGKYVLKSSK